MKSKSFLFLLVGLIIGIILTLAICRTNIAPNLCHNKTVISAPDTITQPLLPFVIKVTEPTLFLKFPSDHYNPAPLSDTSSWSITVLVEDKAGRPMGGASVSIPCLGDELFYTNEAGKLLLFGGFDNGECPCGMTSRITASKGGQSGSKLMEGGCGSYTVIIGKDTK